MAPRLILEGIRFKNLRVFEGEHYVPIDPGLTVLMGRNNSGKSTVLRAPFMFMAPNQGSAPWQASIRAGAETCEIATRYRINLAAVRPAPAFLDKLSSFELTPANAGRLLGHPRFEGWAYDSRFEFGWTGEIHGTRNALTRAVAADDRCFVQVGGGEQDFMEEDGIRQLVHGPPEALHALGRHFATHERAFAYWEHHRFDPATKWIDQPRRRLADADEDRVREVLTFLKMKHPHEFENLASAFGRAFPEFGGLEFIDHVGQGFEFRPGMRLAGAGKEGLREPLAREQVGAGAWAYLSILTAARAAKATRASVLVLDEPHLYLHPGLERQLINDLLDANSWDNEPLQIVAATHSPTFATEALRRGTLNVLQWTDDAHTRASVISVAHSAQPGRQLQDFISEPGELLYSQRVVFVEGASDIDALQMLVGPELARKARWVPLKEADAIAPNIARYFRIVAQAHGPSIATGAALVIDGDKRKIYERAWAKQGMEDPSKCMTILWSDERGNDLESNFCEPEFLAAYFARGSIASDGIEDVVTAKLGAVMRPAERTANKGCTAIAELHRELLTDPATKSDYLGRLISFLQSIPNESAGDRVRANLAKLVDPLKTFLDS